MTTSHASRRDEEASRQLGRLRACGEALVATGVTTSVSGVSPAERADRSVAALGLHPIGEGWRPVDRETAVRVLAPALHEDLAYGAELMPREQATALASDQLGEFADDAIFLTNRNGPIDEDPSLDRPAPFFALTDATFCSAVCVLEPHRV